MKQNPYESPRDSSPARPRLGRNIGCATILFVASIPILWLGGIWALGGSRPHRAAFAVPLGLVTISLAVAMIGLGAHFLLNAFPDKRSE